MNQAAIHHADYPTFLEWVRSQEIDNPDILAEPLGAVLFRYQDYTADAETRDPGADMVPPLPTFNSNAAAAAETPGADFSEMKITREPVATCGQCEHWRLTPGMGGAGHCFNPDAPTFRAITGHGAMACDCFE